MRKDTAQIKFIPNESIGHMKLGMSREEIFKALETMCIEWGVDNPTTIQINEEMSLETDDNQVVRYTSSSNAFMPFVFIVIYKDENAVEISVNRDLSVVYEQQTMQFVDFFGTPADVLVTYLKKFNRCICDNNDEDLGTAYVFPELGLKLSREMAFHQKLLLNDEYMDEMNQVILEEFKYCFFEFVSVTRIV